MAHEQAGGLHGRRRPPDRSGTQNLGEVMGVVARSLQERHGDVEATLQAISAAAVVSVQGAEDCGVIYVRARRHVEPRAWTSDLPRELDELQGGLAEGPCMDAVWDHHVVRVDDMTTEPRWPRFAREAGRRGVGSMLSFHLFVAGDNLGALNMYARSPGAFTEESENIGLLFASHAAVALAGAQHEEHLRTAMDNRDVIGQAKGILMERHKLTADHAFTVLVEVSSRTNRRVLDIALELTDTGAMPPVPQPQSART
jgi:GAF domain-containing protein